MASGRIRYVPDEEGLAEVRSSPQVLAALRSAAEAGRQFAIGISPVHTGRYKRSFAVDTGRDEAGDAEARLVNTATYAAAVEWVNDGGERVLGRTVDFIEQHGA